MTSHDVIDVVRRATREKRVGHGGTLDPCAKGDARRRRGPGGDQEARRGRRDGKGICDPGQTGLRSTTDDREAK
jgi:hypothetical protein